MSNADQLVELFKTNDMETIANAVKALSEREANELLELLEEYSARQEKEQSLELDEHDLIECIYDRLYGNTYEEGALMPLNWEFCYPYPEMCREFAYIKLNDEFVIKVERI